MLLERILLFSNKIIEFVINEWMIFVTIILIGILLLIVDFLLRNRIKSKIKNLNGKSILFLKIMDLLVSRAKYWLIFFAILVIINGVKDQSSFFVYFQAIVLLCLIFSIAKFLRKIIDIIFEETLVSKGYSTKSFSIIKLIFSFIIYSVAFLVYLDWIGVKITPMLATLGVGGIAISLALQDTLSNFISGIQISLNKHLKPGYYVKLSTIEGTIVEISWRYTALRTSKNEIAIIPNAIFVNESVVSIGELGSVVFVIPFSVAYGSDLDQVDILVKEEVTKIVQANKGTDKKYNCAVSVLAHGGSGIDMLVVIKLFDYTQKYKMRNLILRAIYKKFDENNIDIPFPTRTVFLKQQ